MVNDARSLRSFVFHSERKQYWGGTAQGHHFQFWVDFYFGLLTIWDTGFIICIAHSVQLSLLTEETL